LPGNVIQPQIQPQSIQVQRPIVSLPLQAEPVQQLDDSQISPVIRTIQNRQKFATTIPTTTSAFPLTQPTTTRPKTTTEPATDEELEKQAKSAYYKFGTEVHDTINDHEHVRKEVREGLELTGMYSYSDGYFRRTVYYKADEDGYRVTKEEIQPVGDGPKFNKDGKADVKSTLAGDYSINIDDFKLNKKQEEEIRKLSQ
jgi:hypothetical protein